MQEILLTHLAVALLGGVAAFFGALVGGSGLLIIPGLIYLGFPTQKAIAILELGALAMMLTGAYQLNQFDKINLTFAIPITILSAMGAIFGASILIATPPLVAQKAFGVGLLLLIIYITCFQGNINPSQDHTNLSVSSKHTLFGCFLFFLNGLWSGFFSAGSHIFGTFILITYYKQTILKAAGLLKIEGIGSGLVTSITFILAGLVSWSVSVVLALSMSIGAWFGCKWGIKKGEKWIKKLYIAVVAFSAFKLILY